MNTKSALGWRPPEWTLDQTMADAMLDRLLHGHHRSALMGEALSKKATHVKAKADGQPRRHVTGDRIPATEDQPSSSITFARMRALQLDIQ